MKLSNRWVELVKIYFPFTKNSTVAYPSGGHIGRVCMGATFTPPPLHCQPDYTMSLDRSEKCSFLQDFNLGHMPSIPPPPPPFITPLETIGA